jgi:hypothetical protein
VKSIEVVHGSFAAYAGVLAVAVLAVAVLALSGPRARRHLARLGRCAIAGAAAAAALVWYVDAKRHAQLAAQAARPANGHHLTAANVLADGFAATFLAVTVLAFVLATLASRRRPPAPVRMPSRPRAGTRTWLS